MRKYPSSPFDCFHSELIEFQKKHIVQFNENEFRKELEKRLDELAGNLSEAKGGIKEITEAIATDCYLYARTDKYQPKD